MHKWTSNFRIPTRTAVTLLALGLAWKTILWAQTDNAPTVQLQYAAVSAIGNTVTLSRIPVLTAAGKRIYKDALVQFDTDADGNLSLSPGFPQLLESPNLLVSTFRAGDYNGPGSILKGKMLVTVSGPGVSEGGVTTWSLTARSGADECTYPGSAMWYVGPIENNPLAQRLKKAGITSSAWSYGVTGWSCDGYNQPYANFASGSLIGVSQAGNAITVASFSECLRCVSGGDRNAPTGQVSFTLVP